METKSENGFAEVLRALVDAEQPLPPNYFYHLVDLSPEQVEQLREVWPRIPLERRRAILEEMEVVTEDDLTASFKEVGLIGLDDPDAQVRFNAIRVLWVEEDYALIERFLDIAQHDPDVEVRANAVGALGGYMYLASLEELPARYVSRIEQVLGALLEDEAAPDVVRRQALEVLGYSLNLDIGRWIERALAHPQEEWQISGLFAAGRTADPRWKEDVLEYLHDERPALRAEAARAAGEIVLKEAVDDLIDLLEDPESEVRMMAAWALSEIGGGEEVADALYAAQENAATPEEEQALEEALINLAFTDEVNDLLLMDLDPEELEAMIHDDDVDEFLKLFGGEDDEDGEE